MRFPRKHIICVLHNASLTNWYLGGYGLHFINAIFNLVILTGIFRSVMINVLMWIPHDFINDKFKIGSGNGLVLLDNKPLLETILTKLHFIVWCHWVPKSKQIVSDIRWVHLTHSVTCKVNTCIISSDICLNIIGRIFEMGFNHWSHILKHLWCMVYLNIYRGSNLRNTSYFSSITVSCVISNCGERGWFNSNSVREFFKHILNSAHQLQLALYGDIKVIVFHHNKQFSHDT